MEKLQRDVNAIASPAAPSDIHLRTLGHAYGLGALLSVIPDRPLYVSYDISTRAFDIATQLLKRAGEHDVQIAAVEVEVAWTTIASLMTLGPNFVRTYLPQLLVLWRNALPKPTSKDTSNNPGRSVAEWSFLLHVRESALGAILCFLRHNPALVSLDVSRRLSSLLGNALQFSNSFLSQGSDDLLEQRAFSLSLRTREALLRRRIYQCFSSIGFSGIAEATQSSLLQSAMSLFASVDGYTGSSLQAAIASSSGTFNSIWQNGDGYAYGMTYINITDATDHSVENAKQLDKNSRNRDAIEISIDDLVCCLALSSVISILTSDPIQAFQANPWILRT
jgi:HEAT repeat-containing protein 5